MKAPMLTLKTKSPKHVYFKHEGRCPDLGHCNYCDGGLALCVVCGGAEGELPTECPGGRMTREQRKDVYSGILDYKSGRWVDP